MLVFVEETEKNNRNLTFPVEKVDVIVNFKIQFLLFIFFHKNTVRDVYMFSSRERI